jgi:hypothetical protein
MGRRLLADPAHVRLKGIGHELHSPPGQEQRVLQAAAPFLEAVRSSAEKQQASASNASQEGGNGSVHSNKDEEE